MTRRRTTSLETPIADVSDMDWRYFVRTRGSDTAKQAIGVDIPEGTTKLKCPLCGAASMAVARASEHGDLSITPSPRMHPAGMNEPSVRNVYWAFYCQRARCEGTLSVRAVVALDAFTAALKKRARTVSL